MARWHICSAYLAVQSTRHEYSRAFGPGAQVDLDEPIAPGLVLADLIVGREACFAPVEEAHPTAGRSRAPRVNIVPPVDAPSVQE